MIERITMFRTDDNKIHDTHEEAVAYDAKHCIKDSLIDLAIADHKLKYEQQSLVIDFIKRNFEAIIRVTNRKETK